MSDSKAQEHADLLDVIGIAILNERLSKLAAQRDVPILAANASHLRLPGLPDIEQLNVTNGSKGALAAMSAASGALSDLLRNGVTQPELDRSLLDIRTLSEQAGVASATIPTPTIANMLLKSVDQNESFLTPQQTAQFFLSDVQNVTTADVTGAMRKSFTGSTPYVLVAGLKGPPGGAEAVTAAVAQESTVGAAAMVAQEISPAAKDGPWPYQSFGAKGTVVSRQEIADLGITTASFANGVRVTIKPTTFRNGQVLIAVTFGHGRVGLPKTRKVPVWALPTAFSLGGLKLATYDELNARFETKFVGTHFSVGDDMFELAGGTRPQDLDTELQLLGAYVADPGWHADALDKARAAEFLGIGQSQSSPQGVLARNERALLHGDDPRWSVPDIEDVNDSQANAETRAIVADALDGPLDVTIVGDITVVTARLIPSAQTLGRAAAAPERDKMPVIAGDEHFACCGDARPRSFFVTTATPCRLPPRSIGRPLASFRTSEARSMRVLEEVLLHRLYDELRTREGIAYSPRADVAASLLTPDYGYLSAASDIPPDKTDLFYAAVARVVDDLIIQSRQRRRAFACTRSARQRSRAGPPDQRVLAGIAHRYPGRSAPTLDAIRTTAVGAESDHRRQHVQQAAAGLSARRPCLPGGRAAGWLPAATVSQTSRATAIVQRKTSPIWRRRPSS